jgi:hypothetical protein
MKRKILSIATFSFFFTVIITALENPAYAKSLGQAVCGNTRSGDLGTTPITKAILESTKMGYLFRFTWKSSRTVWILNPELVITEAYTLTPKAPNGKGNWNIRVYDGTPVKISPNGSFSIAMMVSSRSGCEFKGNLTFGKGVKEKLFS